jgi:hypothetical protein
LEADGMMKRPSLLGFILLGLGLLANAQSMVGLPSLNQLDSTVFELRFNTDSAAIITVHVAQDTTYRNAFIFLGRTLGSNNQAVIKMEGLRPSSDYMYRILLGTELSLVGGTFTTGSSTKN